MFPDPPQQSGYNKRLRKFADTTAWLVRVLGKQANVSGDDTWVVDSTSVEFARSKETEKRSDLAGFAEYGYCASHSRFFWGLYPHRPTRAGPDRRDLAQRPPRPPRQTITDRLRPLIPLGIDHLVENQWSDGETDPRGQPQGLVWEE